VPELQRHVLQGAHFDATLLPGVPTNEAPGRAGEELFTKALLRPVDREIDGDVVED